jgi:hypothetical protein
VFIRALRESLFWARSIQSVPPRYLSYYKVKKK